VRGGDRAEADAGEGLLVLPEPDAYPALAERAVSSRRPLLTGAPPEAFADRLALVRDALGALVRPDLRGLLVLRLDDPGSAQRRYLSWWRHDDVPAEAWDALWSTLRGFGRVSIFCCPGWVEEDGTVVDARLRNPGEWASLDAGVAAGVADLECHGYTHLHPDTRAWAAAPDRDSTGWFREFWAPWEDEEPAIERQEAIIERWQKACGPGTALAPPGDVWWTNTVRAARRRGLAFLASYGGVCRLQLPVPTWASGIASPYLDEVDPGVLADGLPGVACWHDRDLVVHGPSWVAEQLATWRDAGAVRAISFADLARAYAQPVEAVLAGGEVEVLSAPEFPLLVERA
jgi:hypothetical protein